MATLSTDSTVFTDVIKCLRCSFKGPESSYPRKRNMKFSKTCMKCLGITNGKAAERRAEKHQHTNKENVEDTTGSSECQKGKRVVKHPLTLTWDEFISVLTENKDHPFELEAFVKIDQDPLRTAKSTHDRAVEVANATKEATGFRFKYVTARY